ncbi:GNAT family N-acetyltransferase [Rhodococcus erythropolis]|uniref:GNAT family N-acetyltransferase n=1 Tax=Rhodococcus erythropolis TaxID=1833 RepID=UPI0022B5BED2|nr:GNAT family N-acetyltransferase [Rhodococcus erythropolis]MCZ4569887.1 GNAT family N-acetyltransferase [Rhodococcus erythropolis]
MRVIVSSTRPPSAPKPPGAPRLGPIHVRHAALPDLSTSARLHLEALPVGLFPQLGYRFLRRWHASFVARPHAVAFVAADADQNILGFLLGTLDHRAHLSQVLRDRRTVVSLAAHGFIALAVRPRLAARFVRTRARPWCSAVSELLSLRPPKARRNHSSAREPADATAVLVAIAVDPTQRGHGIGAQLTVAFETAASRYGTPTAELVTAVGDDDSDSSHGFYDRLGWIPARVYLDRDGCRMQVYHRALPATAPASNSNKAGTT